MAQQGQQPERQGGRPQQQADFLRKTRDAGRRLLRTVSERLGHELLARAETVQERWGLPAVKWLKIFKPVA